MVGSRTHRSTSSEPGSSSCAWPKVSDFKTLMCVKLVWVEDCWRLDGEYEQINNPQRLHFDPSPLQKTSLHVCSGLLGAVKRILPSPVYTIADFFFFGISLGKIINNISLTWIKPIWGWFPLLTMIPVRSQWGRYNLPRYHENVDVSVQDLFFLCLFATLRIGIGIVPMVAWANSSQSAPSPFAVHLELRRRWHWQATKKTTCWAQWILTIWCPHLYIYISIIYNIYI